MGFTCGLYKARRHRYTSGKVLDAIDAYITFLKNDIEPFKEFTKDLDGFEAYCKKYDLEFYKCMACFGNLAEYYIIRNEPIYTELRCWSSGALPFHAFLDSNEEFHQFGYKYSTDIELSKGDIFKCLKWCEEYLDKREFIPIVTTNAFKDNPDDTITLIPCDGIEYVDEEGHLERSYSSTWDMTDIYICKECYNEWEINEIKDIKNTLIDILETTDFEKETIFYKGG